MEIHVNPDERRLQVNDFTVETMAECRAFWQDLQGKYPGYEIDFC